MGGNDYVEVESQNIRQSNSESQQNYIPVQGELKNEKTDAGEKKYILIES